MPAFRLIAVGATAVALVAPASAIAKPKITMSGSTSIYPLATSLAKGYLKANPGAASFNLLQGGSDIGIADVSRGRVTIGNSSRDPQPSDPSGLTFNKIARDGVCLVTNPGNPLANLSQQQVQDIFSGRVRRWDDVEGARVKGPIQIVARTAASGTADAFQSIFMGPELRVAGSASTKQTNGLVQQTVRSTPNAIGYVSFDFIAGTSAAPYKGVACNLRNAKSGQYPGVRNFWMVTRGKPTGATGKFLSWIKSSSAADRIVGKHWVPVG